MAGCSTQTPLALRSKIAIAPQSSIAARSSRPHPIAIRFAETAIELLTLALPNWSCGAISLGRSLATCRHSPASDFSNTSAAPESICVNALPLRPAVSVNGAAATSIPGAPPIDSPRFTSPAPAPIVESHPSDSTAISHASR